MFVFFFFAESPTVASAASAIVVRVICGQLIGTRQRRMYASVTADMPFRLLSSLGANVLFDTSQAIRAQNQNIIKNKNKMQNLKKILLPKLNARICLPKLFQTT